MILQVPTGETLTFGDENFIKFEEAGVREARRAAFVLVAGGLGERLGYNGIKVHYIYQFFALSFSVMITSCIYKFVVVLSKSTNIHFMVLGWLVIIVSLST